MLIATFISSNGAVTSGAQVDKHLFERLQVKSPAPPESFQFFVLSKLVSTLEVSVVSRPGPSLQHTPQSSAPYDRVNILQTSVSTVRKYFCVMKTNSGVIHYDAKFCKAR